MKEFGWTIENIKNLPASSFRILVEEMEKAYEEQERKIKEKPTRFR